MEAASEPLAGSVRQKAAMFSPTRNTQDKSYSLTNIYNIKGIAYQRMKENSGIIYFPLNWIYFFSWTQKKIF